MIVEFFIVALLILGAFFMAVAAVGVIRLPDLYMRMHATTKASTLGMLCMLLAVILLTESAGVILKSVLIMFFIFLTAPIASHMIGHVAHLMNVPKWHRTHQDDLEHDRTSFSNEE